MRRPRKSLTEESAILKDGEEEEEEAFQNQVPDSRDRGKKWRWRSSC